MSPQQDGETFERIRAGDLGAFADLVRAWEAPLFRIARRVTGDDDTAEDVVQIVFLRLYRRPEDVREACRVGAWLRRAVVNESISAVRATRRRRRACSRAAESTPATTAREEAPDEGLERREAAAVLSTALDRLDPDDRALLSLKYDDDLSFSQIAAVLDRPVTTVKSQGQRALRRLRRLLSRDSLLL